MRADVNGGVTNLLTGAHSAATAEAPKAKRLRKAEANKRVKKKVPAARVGERYLHPRQTDSKRAG